MWLKKEIPSAISENLGWLNPVTLQWTVCAISAKSQINSSDSSLFLRKNLPQPGVLHLMRPQRSENWEESLTLITTTMQEAKFTCNKEVFGINYDFLKHKSPMPVKIERQIKEQVATMRAVFPRLSFWYTFESVANIISTACAYVLICSQLIELRSMFICSNACTALTFS